MLPATSSKPDARFVPSILSYTASYDVASNICLALEEGESGRRGTIRADGRGGGSIEKKHSTDSPTLNLLLLLHPSAYKAFTLKVSCAPFPRTLLRGRHGPVHGGVQGGD